MRKLISALHPLAYALCLLCHGIAKAEILIVAPESGKAQTIKEELAHRLSTVDSQHSAGVDILVTIGTSAYSEEPSRQGRYSFPLFLSPYDEPQGAKEQSFPVYSEPDPGLLVEHLSAWFNGARVGYLHTDDDPFSAALAEAASSSGIILVSQKVGARDVFAAINDLTKENIGVFLISKNPTLYTNRNIRFVLEALYRKRIPAVATSHSLLNAGAIATISTDDSALLGDVVETISRISLSAASSGGGEHLEMPPFSSRITIKTNKAMEDRFGIYLHHREAQ